MGFLVKLRFWIAVGFLALLSVGAFAAGFLPLRSRNRERLGEWEQLLRSVESVASKELHSRDDVKQAEAAKKRYKEEQDKLFAELKKRARLLGRHMPDPATGQEKPLDPVTWKDVYEAQMTALETEIAKSFDSVPPNLILRKRYGQEWPSEEEMKTEAKRYWIQRYLLEALADANSSRRVVPILRGFSWGGDAERLLHPSDGTLFQPIGFEFQLAMDFENVPLVLFHLLKCEVPLNITSLNIQRAAARGTAGGTTPTVPAAAGRGAQPTPAPGVPSGPPMGIPFGPPGGIPGGPPSTIEIPGIGPLQIGPGAGMPGAPSTGVTAPITRQPRESGVSRAPTTGPATAAAPERADVVNVSVRGYLLDYVSK